MSDLYNKMFTNDEHKTELMRSYSYFLKVLIEEKNKNKLSSRFLAKGLGCSIGKISNFENEKVIDFNMLFDYAHIFQYKLELNLTKKKFSEVMS